MTGWVDQDGRALLKIQACNPDGSAAAIWDGWIDTGFDGHLLVPANLIAALGLPPTGDVQAQLADGTRIQVETYRCLIDWLGVQRSAEVIASAGQNVLVGVGILCLGKLTIDYPGLTVTLE